MTCLRVTHLAEAVDWLGGFVGGGLRVSTVSHWFLAQAGRRGTDLLGEVLSASHLLLVLLFGPPVWIVQKVALRNLV